MAFDFTHYTGGKNMPRYARRRSPGSSDALSLDEKTNLCTEAALEKKAHGLVVLDVRTRSDIADYFMICSGTSARQVQAIADAIDEKLEQAGISALGKEGYAEARWILLDLEDLLVHIFHEEARNYYDLERLWGDVPKVKSIIEV